MRRALLSCNLRYHKLVGFCIWVGSTQTWTRTEPKLQNPHRCWDLATRNRDDSLEYVLSLKKKMNQRRRSQFLGSD